MVVVLQMTPNAIPSLRYRYITPVCPLLCCLVILHLLDSNSFIIILQAVSISTVEDMKKLQLSTIRIMNTRVFIICHSVPSHV